MRLELAVKNRREMWFFDKKSNAIWPVVSVAESNSGDTIDTDYGARIRTCAKNHAIFNSYDFARIAQKLGKNELDAEYDELLQKNNLRRVNSDVNRHSSGN